MIVNALIDLSEVIGELNLAKYVDVLCKTYNMPQILMTIYVTYHWQIKYMDDGNV